MTLSSRQPSPSSPRILCTSAGRGWSDLDAHLLHVPRGLSKVAGGEMHRLGIHVGPPVNADCRCDGRRMRRVQKHGDIDIVPAGIGGSWEDDGDCRILHLSVRPSLVREVADQLGRHVSGTELIPRFQLRDTRLEAIGWAVKADLEADAPSDPLYIDSLAHALAVRLIELASASGSGSSAQADGRRRPRLSPRQWRILTDFIESNLDQKLRLADLAKIAGMSVTRLKPLFRNNTGVSVHQYVIRRRVEYARALMTTTAMPASEVAAAAGFSHQSHMTSMMRRVLGQTPRDIRGQDGEFGPKLPHSA